MNVSNSQQGFSLIELMVTLSIAAITLSLGIPSFRQATQDSYMSNKINELVADINLTRNEAIKRATTVTICSRATNTSCGGKDDAWKNGWLVFVDDDGNGALDPGEIPNILRVHDELPKLTHLYFSRNSITYNGTGFSVATVSSELLIPTGTFTFCDNRGNTKRKGRVVNTTGRVREAITGDSFASCT